MRIGPKFKDLNKLIVQRLHTEVRELFVLLSLFDFACNDAYSFRPVDFDEHVVYLREEDNLQGIICSSKV